jgi:tetratricopeptide (TPR) repeat protein
MSTNLATRFAFSCLLAATPALAIAMGNSGASGATSSPSMNVPQFDTAASYRKGIDALKSQQFSDAKKDFAQVLGETPGDANTNFLAGMADAGLNDLKGAAKHYEKAVRADSTLIPAQQELGITYAKLGDMRKAQDTLGHLQKMNDACKGTCKDADQIKQAIDAVQQAIGQPPHAQLQTDPPFLFASAKAGDTAYLEAVGLINEKRYSEAIEELRRAKATFGAHPDVLTYLGFASRKLGKYDTAVSYYRQALAVAPNHKGATEYYGELMIERGDLAGGEKMLAKLDSLCTFGCAEAEELRRWVEAKGEPAR